MDINCLHEDVEHMANVVPPKWEQRTEGMNNYHAIRKEICMEGCIWLQAQTHTHTQQTLNPNRNLNFGYDNKTPQAQISKSHSHMQATGLSAEDIKCFQ